MIYWSDDFVGVPPPGIPGIPPPGFPDFDRKYILIICIHRYMFGDKENTSTNFDKWINCFSPFQPSSLPRASRPAHAMMTDPHITMRASTPHTQHLIQTQAPHHGIGIAHTH